jgi:hypothetical protein
MTARKSQRPGDEARPEAESRATRSASDTTTISPLCQVSIDAIEDEVDFCAIQCRGSEW